MSIYRRISCLVFGLTTLATAALASDSPQFRGPDRNGIFPGEGLMKSWPESGPNKLWSVNGLGEGFASVTVADGRLFTTGTTGETGYVFAFDAKGKQLWKKEYGKIHNGGGYPGTRTTPTVDEGALYLFSSLGKAAAYDAATGEVRWEVDLAGDLKAPNIRWGITESPLVIDDKVIFTPGAPDATLVALDKKTGKKVWTTSGVGDASGYCSPRLFDNGKHQQIITLTQGHLIAADPKSGELIWKQRYPGKYGIHAVSPVFDGNLIYVSDGYGQGGKAYELAADGKSVTLKWEDENLDIHHGGAVVVNGHIYGASNNGSWFILNSASGAVEGSLRRIGKGAVVYADGRLYGYTEKGEVLLVDPGPEGFGVVGKLEISDGDGQHWAHPVIVGGVLYIRHGDALMAFDISQRG